MVEWEREGAVKPITLCMGHEPRCNTVQLKTRLQEKDSELGSAGRHTPAGAQRIVGHFPLHAPRDTAAPTGDDALRGDFIQKPPVAQAA